MPVLSASTPRQQQLLKEFAVDLSRALNEAHPKVTGEVDYGMLSVPLVGMAVSILKQRGLTRDEIEAMVMQTVEKQFESASAAPILTIVR